MLEEAQARGRLSAPWIAGDCAFGMSPTLREGLAAAGMRYVLDVGPDTTVWPVEPTPYQVRGRLWINPPYPGSIPVGGRIVR